MSQIFTFFRKKTALFWALLVSLILFIIFGVVYKLYVGSRKSKQVENYNVEINPVKVIFVNEAPYFGGCDSPTIGEKFSLDLIVDPNHNTLNYINFPILFSDMDLEYIGSSFTQRSTTLQNVHDPGLTYLASGIHYAKETSQTTLIYFALNSKLAYGDNYAVNYLPMTEKDSVLHITFLRKTGNATKIQFKRNIGDLVATEDYEHQILVNAQEFPIKETNRNFNQRYQCDQEDTSQYDLDHDRNIGVSDLRLLIKHWGSY